MPAIYQADCWCDSCAELDAKGTGDIDTSDERSYDSDEYPKYMGDDEESDCPQHCGAHGDCLEAVELPSGRKIGALLSTSLTSDGVEYVREAIKDGGEVADFWADAFSDYDVVDKCDWCCERARLNADRLCSSCEANAN